MTKQVLSDHPTDGLDAWAGWALVLAAVGLVIAVPVATGWFVGDLSTVPVSAGRDYAVQPLRLDPGAELAIGLGSTVLAIIALRTSVWAARRLGLYPRWWGVLGPLLAAGFVVGFGWRVMTAGVIGANIGAGIVIVLGGPLVVALLLWALAYSIHLMRRRVGRQH